jgi:hypothetical protein
VQGGRLRPPPLIALKHLPMIPWKDSPSRAAWNLLTTNRSELLHCSRWVQERALEAKHDRDTTVEERRFERRVKAAKMTGFSPRDPSSSPQSKKRPLKGVNPPSPKASR